MVSTGTSALARRLRRPVAAGAVSAAAWVPAAVIGAFMVTGCGGGGGLATITSVQADGPELRVAYRTTACTESVEARIVSESPDTVTLEVTQVSGSDCDDPTARGFTTVELTDVLGSRSVVDASTGESVKVEAATA